MRVIAEQKQLDAQNRAVARGLPVRITRPNGAIQEIADFDGDSPIYFTTHNATAAISTAANTTRSTYTVDGTGITIGMWDGGSGRSTHQEFGTRMIVKDGSPSIDHATHVGGTLAAAGVVTSARGMSPAAIVDSYDWNNDISEMTARAATAPGQADKLYLSNHSYGRLSGWVNVGNATRTWEWYGNGTGATGFEQDFGRYNTYSRDQDSLAFNAPYFLMFRSAGNERTDSPSTGQNVALSPGSATVVAYDTALHPSGDGLYRSGFENIGFDALAKNLMTVGSVTDAVTSGLRDPSKANQSSFSSWGPTDDGRIKPDIVANGDGVSSSLNGGDTAYGTYSGTSMSSPNAAGSAALLIQHYKNLFSNGAMRASTLKGLIIHTADDRGNIGPDYKFGWGLMNTKGAADVISDHFNFPEKSRITESQLSSSTTSRTHTFVWDGTAPIRATLSWTDPAGGATTTSDLRTPRLVNNLNVKIISPGGSEHSPYVMPFVGNWSQASMDSPATTGINNTDNVEQVLVSAPPVAGAYQVVVSYSGTLTNNLQNYSLLISGSSAVAPPPSPLSITAITPSSGTSGTVTVDLTGISLLETTAVKLTRSGSTDILATGNQMVGDKLRCQLNLTGAAPGFWNVVATNPNGETSTLSSGFNVVGSIWSENFDSTVSGWTSSPTGWNLVTTASQTPSHSYFIAAPASKITTSLTSPAISVPASANNLQLKFWHSHNLETSQDGGRIEVSNDNGSNWIEVGASGSGTTFASYAYNATINNNGKEADLGTFDGQTAWSGNSGGFQETIIDLTDDAKFAGKTIRLRWTLATNAKNASYGWHIDTVSLVGGGDLSNSAPAITAAASSTTSETVTEGEVTYRILRGTSTTLSVSATDNGGEATLSYLWSSANGGPVFFSPNGTNTAKNTTVSFEALGDYFISVSITDAQGLSVTSQINIRVVQVANDLQITPASVSVQVGGSQSFGSQLLDQFGDSMATQPTSYTWSASDGGTINSSGLFTANAAGGPFVVTSSTPGFSSSASVTVTRAPASITLGNLSQTYNGSPRPVSATTSPAGLAVSTTYNGASQAPTQAGTYSIEAVITDPNYQGSASGTLVIGKATSTVSLTNITATYDGTPKSATATTTPAGLSVATLYDGSSTAPTTAGSYSVQATIQDPTYQGSASGTLVIGKAIATVSLANLTATYDGTPKSATATTTPAGLSVSILYDGSPTAPTNAGSYPIQATIQDTNYQGSSSETLVIGKATATVSLTNLIATYDGTPKSATATTTPAGLSVAALYDGSSTAPTNAGSYPIQATIEDTNYQGSATGTLVIEKALATVTLGSLEATYDGAEKSITAATSPTGLSVAVLYSGSSTAPTNAGSYPIQATIEDTNYQGSATGTLVIDKALATVTLSGLEAIYDGEAKSITVTTAPASLAVSIQYNDSPNAPVAAGTYEVQVLVVDPNHTGSANGILTISSSSNYSEWEELHFSNSSVPNGEEGPNADPDQDGLSNLAEYALGTDPKAFDPPIAPVVDAVFLSLTFQRPKGLTDVSYGAEVTANMNDWTQVPLEVISETETTETVRAKVSRAQSPQKQFLRLRFAQ